MEKGRIVRILILVVVIVVAIILFASGVIFPEQQGETTKPDQLISVTAAIQERLDAIAGEVEKASAGLSTGIKGEEAEKTLYDVFNETPDAVLFYSFSLDGIIAEVTPDSYNISSLNLSLSGLPDLSGSVVQGPAMTEVVEYDGYYVFEIVRPVYDEDREIIGGVAAVIDSFSLLGGIINPEENTSGNTFTVMQTDGLILYDMDKRQVGANLFTDDIFSSFPNLRNLGVRFTTQSEGYGSYSYYPTGSSDGGSPVKKLAYWDSAGLYGTEWRVIMFKGALVAG
jgi:type II secretory pathway pseudopilin PulG